MGAERLRQAAAAAAPSAKPRDAHSAGAWRKRLGIARDRDDAAAVLEALSHLCALAPDDLPLARRRADVLLDLGRLDDAETAYREILAAQPASPTAWWGLARLAQRRGEPQSSLDRLTEALRLDPGNPKYREVRLDLLCKLGRLDEAEAEGGALIRAAPERPGVWQRWAHIAKARGDEAAVIERLAGASKAFPDRLPFRIDLAKALADRGGIAEARALLEREDAPEPAALMTLGALERAAGNREAAATAFERASAGAPADAQARVELATELFALRRFEEAEGCLAALLALEPDNGAALNLLASWRRLGDKLDEAIALNRRALAGDPANTAATLGMACSLLAKAEFVEALETLDGLDARAGASQATARLRSGILRRQGAYREAGDVLDRARADFPQSFDLWRTRVALAITAGQLETAEAELMAPPPAPRDEAATTETLWGRLELERWNLEAALARFDNAERQGGCDVDLFSSFALAALLVLDTSQTEAQLRRLMQVQSTHRVFKGQSLNVSQTPRGQLLDEFRLDPEALARARAALQAPADRRLAELLAAARDFPDYTAAAILFLVEAARRGELSARTRPQDGPSPIPRRLFQYWNSELVPPDVEAFSRTWRRLNPGFEWRRFSDADARAYLRETLPEEVLRAYRYCRQPAMKADVLRLAVLFNEGGYYADSDDRCVAPLSTLPAGAAPLILYQEDIGTVGNNFVAAVPRHPVIARALERAVEAVNRGDGDGVWLATGPALMTRSLVEVLAEADDWRAARAGMAVLSRSELFRAVTIHCALAYKQSDLHWSRPSADIPHAAAQGLMS